MTKFDHYDGYNPQHDKYATDEEREEGFFETLDRVVENWRMIGLAILIALPLAGLAVWVYKTYIFVP